MPWPTEVRLNPGRDVLAVAFDSGEKFDLRAEYLRVESPSAEVTHSRRPDPAERQIVLGKEDVKIAGLEPVGNYALRIGFDDGHDSGLFSWDYLYKLGQEETKIWAEYKAAAKR